MSSTLITTAPVPRARARTALILAVTLLAGLLPFTTPPANATNDPDRISFTLEGCRNPGTDYNPDATPADLVCDDKNYTTGNLGKSWNELDLVPHRVTLVNAHQTQTYTFIVAGDYVNNAGTAVGWDFISELTLNTAKSDPACQAVTTGPLTITPEGQGAGGAHQTIYRTVTITQPANTTCVYDYYQRLAVGASKFSGSSLQSNLWNQRLTSSGIGQKRISIPVKEILPQELSKTMRAQQGASNLWTLEKTATPAEISFDDLCDPTAPKTANVTVKISWTKSTVPGENIIVTTTITVTNPSHRTVEVTVSDQVYAGPGFGNPVLPPDVRTFALPPGSLSYTNTHVRPSGEASFYHDVATASYQDVLTGAPIPGTTTATASANVQTLPADSGATATVSDVETITGTGLKFRVTSVTGPGAPGTFTPAYTPGASAPLVTNLTWNSATQSGSGSVTFNKQVVAEQVVAGSGALADTATLTPAGQAALEESAEVDITLDAEVDLDIRKTIPNVLTGNETQTFHFEVSPGSTFDENDVVKTESITFTANQTDKTVTVSGLEPGTYTVRELPATGWDAQADKTVTITLPACSGGVRFDNTHRPARAQVRKVTLPAGHEAGWTFTLTGPGVPTNTTVTTTGAGFIQFPVDLTAEGTYTVTETPQSGWDQTSPAGTCQFAVNFPADAGRTFDCVFTNTQRGQIIIEKITIPAGSAQQFAFAGDVSGSLSHGQTASRQVVPGTYTSSETVPAGWDLVSIQCDDANSTGAVNTATATFRVEPGETVKCTFTNRQRGSAEVIKTTNGAIDPTKDWQFRLSGPGLAAGGVTDTSFGKADGKLTFGGVTLTPGVDYTLCELNVPASFSALWKLDGVIVTPTNPDNPENLGNMCYTFQVAPGEKRVFEVDNSRPGGEPRTIGYWKNWNRCTGGNQAANADRNGGSASGYYLVEDLLPQTIGKYTVDTCIKAVRLLNKQDSSGRNKANDAAYELGAQMLAARFNLAAGAETCNGDAQKLVDDAQALLLSINFTGTGDYLGSKVKGQLATVRAQALALAQQLDDYNNGDLC
ncbi:MAG TPA: hypothetical protein VM324_04910 [Egibacteraceae bacterium]|jgi:uncharacterized cupredoxin-like copper-binding protein|nr:hypothetical protein [Egibacteraceae bacterium]